MEQGNVEDIKVIFKRSSNEKIPNPAAVLCKECGGTYEIRTNPSDGSQYGVCIINGKEYNAWEFFYKHHKKKEKKRAGQYAH